MIVAPAWILDRMLDRVDVDLGARLPDNVYDEDA
jgi:hypothetical protein